jgi:hypothetical protein
MPFQGSFQVGGKPNNPFGSIISLLMIIGVFIVLFFMVSGFIKLLYLVAPVLLIATLLINYRLVADYVLGVFETFQTDILMGIVKVLFSVFCYPFVIGWLFAKAMFYRKVIKLQKDLEQQMGTLHETQHNTQFTDYEEISSDLNTDKTPEKTPEKPIIIESPPKQDPLRDDFDQLFK